MRCRWTGLLAFARCFQVALGCGPPDGGPCSAARLTRVGSVLDASCSQKTCSSASSWPLAARVVALMVCRPTAETRAPWVEPGHVAVAPAVMTAVGLGLVSLWQRAGSRPLAMAAVLAIYDFTEVVGAYGFLAAFAGGLSFRRYEWDHEAHDRVHGGADLLENITELGMVLLLGSTVTFAGLAAPGFAGWLLVPVLLVVIRPLATLLAFLGSKVQMKERLLIGWFGIRGIGSFY